jgi:hypothetical protein
MMNGMQAQESLDPVSDSTLTKYSDDVRSQESQLEINSLVEKRSATSKKYHLSVSRGRYYAYQGGMHREGDTIYVSSNKPHLCCASGTLAPSATSVQFGMS